MAIKKPLQPRRSYNAHLNKFSRASRFPIYCYNFSISSIVRPVACAMLSERSPMVFKFRAISSYILASNISVVCSILLNPNHFFPKSLMDAPVSQHFAHTCKRTHNADIGLDCKRRTKDTAQHGNPIFCKSIR